MIRDYSLMAICISFQRNVFEEVFETGKLWVTEITLESARIPREQNRNAWETAVRRGGVTAPNLSFQ